MTQPSPAAQLPNGATSINETHGDWTVDCRPEAIRRPPGAANPTRAKNLLIAAAYSWDELLEEPGVGTVTATEIQLWLEERGAYLRASD